jgi:hypothetical protein
MPNINDVFTELQQANTRLQQLHNDLTALTNSTNATNSAINAGFANLSQGFQALITLASYTNTALAHNAQQNDTMICSLEQIAERVCLLLNEAHTQTGLQSQIAENTAVVKELLKTVHADAALELSRREDLRRQIEACCPPEEPEPICVHEPCQAPGPVGPPPRVDYAPFRPAPRE